MSSDREAGYLPIQFGVLVGSPSALIHFYDASLYPLPRSVMYLPLRSVSSPPGFYEPIRRLHPFV